MAILRGSASSTGRREGPPTHARVRDPRAASSRQQRDPPGRRPLPFILIETIPLMRANLEKGRSRPYRVQSSFGGAWRSSPRAFRTPWYRVADVSNQASNRQRKAHPWQSFGSRHKRFASLHFSPPDGRSTRYDRQDFVALACRAQRTVQVRLRAPSGSRLVLTALSPTSPRHVVRHAG